jgi:hypothetical protein
MYPFSVSTGTPKNQKVHLSSWLTTYNIFIFGFKFAFVLELKYFHEYAQFHSVYMENTHGFHSTYFTSLHNSNLEEYIQYVIPHTVFCKSTQCHSVYSVNKHTPSMYSMNVHSVQSLQSHCFHTRFHWSSGPPVCFLSEGPRFNPQGRYLCETGILLLALSC